MDRAQDEEVECGRGKEGREEGEGTGDEGDGEKEMWKENRKESV